MGSAAVLKYSLEVLGPRRVGPFSASAETQDAITHELMDLGKRLLHAQKRLLLLSSAEEFGLRSEVSGQIDFYEGCRLTTLIFSVAVTFSIPDTLHVL